ncbi:MAG: hypothetical protein E7195_05545 [Peptococcaceae bacterium]|nr:hypothetical protein [Peptococcaceae bacterium]
MNIGGKGERLLKLPRYKREWRNICAILPAYLPDGTNGTEITYTDGTAEPVERRLDWVLNDILGHLKSSKAILEKQSKIILDKEVRRVPLILCPDFALVPVKGREAVGEHDKSTGYIVLKQTEKIMPGKGGGCRICFQGGASLTVYDTPRTLWKNIQLAEQINRQMCA